MTKCSPPSTHPQWCDPLRCHTTNTDVQHCSELIPLRLQDAQLTLCWVQADEFGFPDEPGTPELRIDIVHGMEGQDSTLYLSPEEIQQFVDRLSTEYHRQRYLSAPVVHDTRVVA